MKSISVSMVTLIAALLSGTSEAGAISAGMELDESPHIFRMTSRLGRLSSPSAKAWIPKKRHSAYYSSVGAYQVIEDPSISTYVFELIGAVAGGIIGAMPTAVMGLAYYPDTDDIYPRGDMLSWHPILYAGAAGGILVGPYGVTRVGRRFNQNGSFWHAVIGSIAVPCMLGLAQPLLEDFPYRYFLPIMGIPLGAVIGYNL